ncbi:hypothetical protein, partial [Lactobacillus sp. UMNPBX1]|uniref:hypothetical protein n=1 Tax=Lactobacillus sp. UMNPBX1 TaxID=2042046 RepID=UPI001E5CB247
SLEATLLIYLIFSALASLVLRSGSMCFYEIFILIVAITLVESAFNYRNITLTKLSNLLCK